LNGDGTIAPEELNLCHVNQYEMPCKVTTHVRSSPWCLSPFAVDEVVTLRWESVVHQTSDAGSTSSCAPKANALTVPGLDPDNLLVVAAATCDMNPAGGVTRGCVVSECAEPLVVSTSAWDSLVSFVSSTDLGQANPALRDALFEHELHEVYHARWTAGAIPFPVSRTIAKGGSSAVQKLPSEIARFAEECPSYRAGLCECPAGAKAVEETDFDPGSALSTVTTTCAPGTSLLATDMVPGFARTADGTAVANDRWPWNEARDISFRLLHPEGARPTTVIVAIVRSFTSARMALSGDDQELLQGDVLWRTTHTVTEDEIQVVPGVVLGTANPEMTIEGWYSSVLRERMGTDVTWNEAVGALQGGRFRIAVFAADAAPPTTSHAFTLTTALGLGGPFGIAYSGCSFPRSGASARDSMGTLVPRAATGQRGTDLMSVGLCMPLHFCASASSGRVASTAGIAASNQCPSVDDICCDVTPRSLIETNNFIADDTYKAWMDSLSTSIAVLFGSGVTDFVGLTDAGGAMFAFPGHNAPIASTPLDERIPLLPLDNVTTKDDLIGAIALGQQFMEDMKPYFATYEIPLEDLLDAEEEATFLGEEDLKRQEGPARDFPIQRFRANAAQFRTWATQFTGDRAAKALQAAAEYDDFVHMLESLPRRPENYAQLLKEAATPEAKALVRASYVDTADVWTRHMWANSNNILTEFPVYKGEKFPTFDPEHAFNIIKHNRRIMNVYVTDLCTRYPHFFSLKQGYPHLAEVAARLSKWNLFAEPMAIARSTVPRCRKRGVCDLAARGVQAARGGRSLGRVAGSVSAATAKAIGGTVVATVITEMLNPTSTCSVASSSSGQPYCIQYISIGSDMIATWTSAAWLALNRDDDLYVAEGEVSLCRSLVPDLESSVDGDDDDDNDEICWTVGPTHGPILPTPDSTLDHLMVHSGSALTVIGSGDASAGHFIVPGVQTRVRIAVVPDDSHSLEGEVYSLPFIPRATSCTFDVDAHETGECVERATCDRVYGGAARTGAGVCPSIAGAELVCCRDERRVANPTFRQTATDGESGMSVTTVVIIAASALIFLGCVLLVACVAGTAMIRGRRSKNGGVVSTAAATSAHDGGHYRMAHRSRSTSHAKMGHRSRRGSGTFDRM
jgi:hypothetical protein